MRSWGRCVWWGVQSGEDGGGGPAEILDLCRFDIVVLHEASHMFLAVRHLPSNKEELYNDRH
jgi:hypothetical protein